MTFANTVEGSQEKAADTAGVTVGREERLFFRRDKTGTEK
jgi:hypothetical protein